MQQGKRVATMAKAFVAACALAALLVTLSCTSTLSDDLPASHMSDNNSVNVGHARCGACHLNAQRDELHRSS